MDLCALGRLGLGFLLLAVAGAGCSEDDSGDPTLATAPSTGASATGDSSGSSATVSTGATGVSESAEAGSDTSTAESATGTPETQGPETEGLETGSDSTGPSPNQLPPTSGDALLVWLQDSSYTAWPAESGVHLSAGPHGAGVRTFVNESLLASLEAGNATHPVDAAVVKELYDGDTITGWAVMVKVVAGAGGDSWYWYESVGNAVYADGVGVGLCTDCHTVGVDQIQSPFPLQ